MSLTRLSPRSLSAYTSHLIELTPEDRFLRFGKLMADEQIQNYVDHINLNRDSVFVTLGNGETIGALHCAAFNDAEGYPVVELALSVSAGHRRTGIGRRLVSGALAFCRREGITSALLLTSEGNRAARQFARKLDLNEREAGDFSHPLLTPTAALRTTSTTEHGVEIMRAGENGAHQTAWLIHGAGGDAWQWRLNVMPRLVEAGFSVVSASMHAASGLDKNDSACAVAHAQFFLNTFAGTRPDIVVGHSLGCIAAAHVAHHTRPGLLALANAMPADGMTDDDREHSVAALDCQRAAAILRRASTYSPPPATHGPLLVVSSASDRVSPTTYAERTTRHHRSSYSVHAKMLGGHLSIRRPDFARAVQAAYAFARL